MRMYSWLAALVFADWPEVQSQFFAGYSKYRAICLGLTATNSSPSNVHLHGLQRCQALCTIGRQPWLGGFDGVWGSFPACGKVANPRYSRSLPKQKVRFLISMSLWSQDDQDVGVSIHGGTPKWMVYSRKSIYKWMIWRYPLFRKPLWDFQKINEGTSTSSNNHSIDTPSCQLLVGRTAERYGFDWRKGMPKTQPICHVCDNLFSVRQAT